jgi:hypothetical protein
LDRDARNSCNPEFVLRNVTVKLEEKALRWAAEENTSLSKLLGPMLTEEMRRDGDYWKAYEKWKRIKPTPGLASGRLGRDEANARSRSG